MRFLSLVNVRVAVNDQLRTGHNPISTTSLIKLLEASRTSSFRTSLMR